jgi:SAM-dependent methyltransferase
MTHIHDYDAAFYSEGSEHARRSAARIVPQVLEWLTIANVIDLGCGVGSWLAAFAARGIDVLGVDGDHVDRATLEIPAENFMARDLTDGVTLDRTFSLAMSVEVAEHLPPTSAAPFVRSLCRLAPLVLFSAAVPSQGGVHHVNEQWPNYWADLFAAEGYVCVDCLRPRIWADSEVSWWYAQNILLYIDETALSEYPALAEFVVTTPACRVHPSLVEHNLHRLRLQNALLEILEHAPAGSRVIVADDGQLSERGPKLARDFLWIPFPEHDGEYWGAPQDGAAAIRELQRMRREGGNVLAIVWPAFWWMDHYQELAEYLSGSPRMHESRGVLMFVLDPC